MIHADDELTKWQEQWRTQPAVPVALRRAVERDLRGRRLMMLASVAVTVIMGGGTTLWAARSGDSSAIGFALAVWIFIAVAWVLTLRLERRRGPWRPLAETTSSFLDYAIRSRRARQQAIVTSAVLYVPFFVFGLVWRYRNGGNGVPMDPWTYLTSLRVLALLAASAVLAVLALIQRRRLDRELHNLEHMRNTLEGS